MLTLIFDNSTRSRLIAHPFLIHGQPALECQDGEPVAQTLTNVCSYFFHVFLVFQAKQSRAANGLRDFFELKLRPNQLPVVWAQSLASYSAFGCLFNSDGELWTSKFLAANDIGDCWLAYPNNPSKRSLPSGLVNDF